MPIVRTFAPVRRRHRPDERTARFAFFNVIGAAAWVGIISLAGYGLGNVPVVKNNFQIVIIAIIVISISPASSSTSAPAAAPRPKYPSSKCS